MIWRVGVLVALGCAFIAPRAAAAPAPCDQTPDPARWVSAGAPDPPPARGVFAVHRGGGTIAPEETIGAYSASIAYGADWIEGDIHETKDGHYVLIHDDTIDRLTGTHDNVPVASLTLAQLKKLNIANYGDFALSAPRNPKQAYNPSRITELGEALAFASANGVGMDLDVKDVSSTADLALYASRYPAFQRSFFEVYPHEAEQMRLVRPDTNLMYNVLGGDGSPAEPPGTLYGLTLAPLSYRYFGSTLAKFPPEKVAEIHDGCGVALPHSYDQGNENEAAQIKLGMSRGIDGFQVNAPDVAAAAMGRPVATAIRFPADSTSVCLRNAGNGNGLPYKRLSFAHSSVLTLRFGCVALPAGAGAHVRVAFAGDASALASAARR
jgi:Glycerophosphoryl diester phosphodiesterase family